MPANARRARVKPRRDVPPAARDPPESPDTDRPACPDRRRDRLVAAAQARRAVATSPVSRGDIEQTVDATGVIDAYSWSASVRRPRARSSR